jgi:dynein heavy chain
MTTLKVLQTEPDSFLDQQMVTILLRGGAALSLDQVPRKPFDWLQMNAWFNICQLSSSLDFFGDLKTAVEQNEQEWKKWYEAEAPETLVVPRLEDRLASHPSGPFMRFLIVRSFRDDRTRLAANAFIGNVLGERYIDPAPTRLDEIHAVSDNKTPVVLLLTPGADPTSQLEELAKKKGVKIYAVSMGEGQEPHARKSMEQGIEEGAWSLLQNCHLGLQVSHSTRHAHVVAIDCTVDCWGLEFSLIFAFFFRFSFLPSVHGQDRGGLDQVPRRACGQS